MSKLTRRFKKNKKNKTIKKGGAVKEREGVLDMIGDKINDIASSAATKVADATLKIAGLERIDKSVKEEIDAEKDTEKIDENIEKIGDAASSTLSNVQNIADKTGSAIIQGVNEVLGSDAAKETTKQAAEDTAEIVKESAEVFNKALDDPEVKAEVEKAIENAGEVGEVVMKAAEKPLEKAIDVAANSAQKATSATVSGAIKVGTDALGAVPFWGAIIDFGKMLNDGTRAASAAVEAGSEAVEVASDAFIQTKENIAEGLKELEEKKKMAEEISNRTTKSINNFEKPITTQKTGGGTYKTRRKFLKHKAKSKRVKFAI
jgi:hypothetical protein